MTGLSAVAGAAGEADARALNEEVRKARADRETAQAAEPTPEDSRATDEAVEQTNLDRQDHPREQTEEQAHSAHTEAEVVERQQASQTGSLLDVVA